MRADANGKTVHISPGSETMACLILGAHGNPGDPATAPLKEYAG
jgi:hypothetical protein